jgi:hypothetical protein
VPPPPPVQPARGGPPRPPTSAQPPLNGFAVAALILGILGSGCLLAVVFGIVALVQIKGTGQRGRGMAIAGIVLSVIWVVAGVAAVALGIGWAKDTVTRANDVQVGDCVADVPDVNRVTGLTAVPCAQPHQAEVVEVIELPGGDFPGEPALTKQGQDTCGPALSSYAPRAGRDGSVQLLYIYPTQATWALGDHQITCLAVHQGGAVTGSIRGK